MGTKKSSKAAMPKLLGVADALFTKVQQRQLAVLSGNPGRSFYANELIGLAGSGTGAVQRELARLRDAAYRPVAGGQIRSCLQRRACLPPGGFALAWLSCSQSLHRISGAPPYVGSGPGAMAFSGEMP